jgi:predicted aldo/keto reductase-like oxidoreductase
LAQNKATIALPGFSSVEEVEENVLASVSLPSPDEISLEAMRANLFSELNTLCTTCAYCDSCPEGVPIPKLLDSYNLYILTKGDGNEVLKRIRNHWGIRAEEAAKCSACGQCELLCTQKLPIIERLERIVSFIQ